MKFLQTFSIFLLTLSFFHPIFGFSPSSPVFILGGATSDDSVSIYNKLKELSGQEAPKIVVAISAASSLSIGLEAYYISEPNSKSYEKLFIDYGFQPSVLLLARDNYLEGSSSNYSLGRENIEKVEEADVIFFNGGDQSRHSRAWLNDDGSDSDIMAVLRARFDAGEIVSAGTSAGLAIQCDPTFGSGRSYGYYFFNSDLKSCRIGEELEDDRDGSGSYRRDVNGAYMKGFGFIQGILLDSHFDARGRFGRLASAMKSVNFNYGIGVEEDTAALIQDGTVSVFGSGGIWILDGSNASFPNESEYFEANNFVVSYLTEGDTYSYELKTVSSSKELISDPKGNAYQSNQVYSGGEGLRSITSLLDSSSEISVGYSSESRPTSRVVFRKEPQTIGYKSGSGSKIQFSIDKLFMDFTSILFLS